jgi:hypothetical protein
MNCRTCIHTTEDDWHELKCQNEQSESYGTMVEDDDICEGWEGADLSD